MKQSLALLLLLMAACAADPEPAPEATAEASSEEQKADPLKKGRELIDQRESGDSIDRALRLLDWHAKQKPESAEIRTLTTEAYSRALDLLEDRKSQEKARIKSLLGRGKPHAEAAIKLAPSKGETQYWRACFLLHQADYDQSLGEAKEALALLEKAEASAPKTDDGGPSRMKGRVLHEMPGLFGGSLAKAVASYKKSLDVAPNFVTTHLWLGEAYADGKRSDLARHELEGVVASTSRPGHDKEDTADRKKAEERLKSIKK
ncbi:MAG TPA: hypothetical protein VE981_13215 [Planctomycetota bacterium]|nr:hypothetical protein [Planctomycetota bacterium]